MVQYTRETWRDFVWLSAAVAGLNLVLLMLFYPESNFHRPHEVAASQTGGAPEDHAEKGASESTLEQAPHHGTQYVDHVHVPWISIWSSFITVDKTVNIFGAVLRSLAFLAFPNVLWAVFVYGTALSAQIILMLVFRCDELSVPLTRPDLHFRAS